MACFLYPAGSEGILTVTVSLIKIDLPEIFRSASALSKFCGLSLPWVIGGATNTATKPMAAPMRAPSAAPSAIAFLGKIRVLQNMISKSTVRYYALGEKITKSSSNDYFSGWRSVGNQVSMYLPCSSILFKYSLTVPVLVSIKNIPVWVEVCCLFRSMLM